MPKINITNFNAIEAELPQATIGLHKCRIVGVEVKTSKRAEAAGQENNMLAWQFIVTEGESEGVNLFLNSMLFGDKPNSAFMTKKICVAADIPFDDEGFDPDEAKGCELLIQVTSQEYLGNFSNKAKDVKKI